MLNVTLETLRAFLGAGHEEPMHLVGNQLEHACMTLHLGRDRERVGRLEDVVTVNATWRGKVETLTLGNYITYITYLH